MGLQQLGEFSWHVCNTEKLTTIHCQVMEIDTYLTCQGLENPLKHFLKALRKRQIYLTTKESL